MIMHGCRNEDTNAQKGYEVVMVNGSSTCLVVELRVDGVDGVSDLGDLGDLLVAVEVRRQLHHTHRDAGGRTQNG